MMPGYRLISSTKSLQLSLHFIRIVFSLLFFLFVFPFRFSLSFPFRFSIMALIPDVPSNQTRKEFEYFQGAQKAIDDSHWHSARLFLRELSPHELGRLLYNCRNKDNYVIIMLLDTMDDEKLAYDKRFISGYMYDTLNYRVIKRLDVADPMMCTYEKIRTFLDEQKAVLSDPNKSKKLYRLFEKYIEEKNIDVGATSIRNKKRYTYANIAVHFAHHHMLRFFVRAGTDPNAGCDLAIQIAGVILRSNAFKQGRMFPFLIGHGMRITEQNKKFFPLTLSVLKKLHQMGQLDALASVIHSKASVRNQTRDVIEFVLRNLSVDCIRIHDLARRHSKMIFTHYHFLKERGVDMKSACTIFLNVKEISALMDLVRKHPEILHFQCNLGLPVWFYYARDLPMYFSFSVRARREIVSEMISLLDHAEGQFSWDFIPRLYRNNAFGDGIYLGLKEAKHLLHLGAPMSDILKAHMRSDTRQKLIQAQSFVTMFPSRRGRVLVRPATNEPSPISDAQRSRLFDHMLPPSAIWSFLKPDDKKKPKPKSS
jgi:hypothetical protein